MQLYNTLTRRLELFEPQNSPEVSLYTCGPTVYDYQQIGNWAAYVRWDTLQRTLKESGYILDWVMNVTDVGHLVSDEDHGEDKMQKGAKREGKTAWEIARFYTDDFLKGMQALNIQHPTHFEPATNHIDAQIDLVKRLDSKGYTYVIDDGVYFDTSKLKDYGKLAKLDAKGQKEGARVEVNSQNATQLILPFGSSALRASSATWNGTAHGAKAFRAGT